MTGLGQDDLLAGFQHPRVTVGQDVQQRGRRRTKDGLPVARVHEGPREGVGIIDRRGALLRKGIPRPQLHVGLGQVAMHPVGHETRNLGSAGVFQENRLAGQGGKMRADLLLIWKGVGHGSTFRC